MILDREGVEKTFNWDVITSNSIAIVCFLSKNSKKRAEIGNLCTKREQRGRSKHYFPKCPSIGRLFFCFWPFHRWQFCRRRVFQEWQTKMGKLWYLLFHNRAATTRATARGWPASARTWTCPPRLTWGLDTLFTTLETKSGEKKELLIVDVASYDENTF